jgi:hypothetical protein
MKLDEMAKSCSVFYSVESCDLTTVDNSGSSIRMLISSTTHIFVGAHLDQTISTGNKHWVVS